MLVESFRASWIHEQCVEPLTLEPTIEEVKLSILFWPMKFRSRANVWWEHLNYVIKN